MKHVRSLLPLPSIKITTYGIDHPADFQARALRLESDDSSFEVYKQDTLLGSVTLAMPGKHNVLNALAAISVGSDLEIPFETISAALSCFKGIDRRFSFKGTFQGADIFDDYGHHPQEMYYTFLVARKKAKGKLTVVFQPHRYTRTHKLWDQFLQIFKESPIDHLIITDIFPASEAPIAGVDSQRFVQELQKTNPSFTIDYVPLEHDFSSIKKKVASLIHDKDLLLLLGAGKVNKLVDFL